MKILRLGGLGVSAFRILDLVHRKEIDNITIVYSENQIDRINVIKRAIDFFDDDYLKGKINFLFIKTNLYQKAKEKIINKWPIFLGIPFNIRTKYYRLLDFIDPETVIWVGDNDFDGSNFFVPWLRSKGINNLIIRSYKETRFKYKKIEKLTLELSDKIIVPNKEYLNFFKQLYGSETIDVNKFFFADLDWRYSKLVKWVQNLKVEKLSKKEGKPHICILTGRAIWDPTEERSASRYYYIPLIKNLLKHNIVVHLHALKIIKNLDNPIESNENPYYNLAAKSDNFYIEKPLNLEGNNFEDYKILKRYDAGILHNSSSNVEPFTKFQKINIPNRLYEYQISNVLPILKYDELPATREVIKDSNFGIIYEDFQDLSLQLRDIVNSNYTYSIYEIKTFKDFVNVLLDSIFNDKQEI